MDRISDTYQVHPGSPISIEGAAHCKCALIDVLSESQHPAVALAGTRPASPARALPGIRLANHSVAGSSQPVVTWDSIKGKQNMVVSQHWGP